MIIVSLVTVFVFFGQQLLSFFYAPHISYFTSGLFTNPMNLPMIPYFIPLLLFIVSVPTLYLLEQHFHVFYNVIKS